MVVVSKARLQTILETDEHLFPKKPGSVCSLSAADKLWVLGRELGPKSDPHAMEQCRVISSHTGDQAAPMGHMRPRLPGSPGEKHWEKEIEGRVP